MKLSLSRFGLSRFGLGAAALAAFSATLLASSASRAYCPSYGKAAGCIVEPALGQNPDTNTMRSYFDKLGSGTFTPAEGPALEEMKAGCGKPNVEKKEAATFPCHVLYALSQQESDWTQFCEPETPQSAVGKPERTIVSFDCGYGVAQVTSGMRAGENPGFDQPRVASDTLYNMIIGTRILREKWQFVACVGDRDPKIVEHWYAALWAYNGLAYVNNPNNPNKDAGRGPYNPSEGGSYTYQERVYGWMEYPKDARWKEMLPAYPNRGEIGTGSSPKALSDPKCASPTSCAQSRTINVSPCAEPPKPEAPDAGAPPPAKVEPKPAADAGEPAENQAELEGVLEEGCACDVVGRGSSSKSGGVLALAALSMIAMRRRRSAR